MHESYNRDRTNDKYTNNKPPKLCTKIEVGFLSNDDLTLLLPHSVTFEPYPCEIPPWNSWKSMEFVA